MDRSVSAYNNFFRETPKHRRVTLICTIGPATSSQEMIDQLVECGMDVARLNFSHGSHKQKADIITRIRSAEKRAGRPIAILQDLQGPKLRVGELRGGKPVELKTGMSVTISTAPCFGTAERLYVDYPHLSKETKRGDAILLSDGTITLRVAHTHPAANEIECDIIHGGLLYPRKGVNLPGVKLSIPSLTDKDKDDLVFGIEHGVDWVALSFVREADDIESLRKRITELRMRLGHTTNSVPPKIIAKIEKPEAVFAIASILEAADGIMVARGDLGVEMKQAIVPVIQKEIISLANTKGKPVITATQMLESMVHAPIPTRAEASDVANAVFDGSDAIMLSAETAAGEFPLEAVQYLDRIARETETSPLFSPRRPSPSRSISESIAASACEMAGNIRAACIVVFTHTGASVI